MMRYIGNILSLKCAIIKYRYHTMKSYLEILRIDEMRCSGAVQNRRCTRSTLSLPAGRQGLPAGRQGLPAGRQGF